MNNIEKPIVKFLDLNSQINPFIEDSIKEAQEKWPSFNLTANVEMDENFIVSVHILPDGMKSD